jgi:LCP family protein required for cell wall assembly
VTLRNRIVAGVTAAAVLLAIGAVVGVRALIVRWDRMIPQTDLFGLAAPSPTGQPTNAPPVPDPAVPDGADIKGPLNILIAGQDTRLGDPVPLAHSDAVVIMHISADLAHATLVSLPRDLLVNVPADPVSGSGADFTKLTHSMTYGSRVPGTIQQNIPGGFALLAKTVSGYTGIDHFDAGAVVSFDGLSALGDAIGGIDIYVDQPVTSIHKRPDGVDREWCDACPHQYTGPAMYYPVGMMHMVGWQILDYSRQRYDLPNGAYDREKHHRQILKAMISKIVSFDLITHPFVPDYVVQALGNMMVMDLRGRQLHEYAYALRNLRPENITLVGLPGGGVYSGGNYLGEALQPIEAPFFASLRADNIPAFLAGNPSLVNASGP